MKYLIVIAISMILGASNVAAGDMNQVAEDQYRLQLQAQEESLIYNEQLVEREAMQYQKKLHVYHMNLLREAEISGKEKD